jgi:vitamin B12 transporter
MTSSLPLQPGRQRPVRVPLSAVAVFSLGLSLFSATSWSAQNTDPVSSPEAEETMIVTAHRIEVPASRAGSSVSTIDRDLLLERQSVLAVDVLQDLPSVSVSRTSGYGSLTDVRIRGAEANQVLVVIDGVEANDPALGDSFDFNSLSSYDIDNIEVLRGPQSALWGSDAAAGVINIRTRQGDPGFAAGAFVEAGSSATRFGGGNASYNTDRGGISVHGSYFDTDGEDATVEGDEDDGFDNLNLSMNGRWQPTETARLSMFSRYTEANSDYDGTDFTTGLPADADNDSEDESLLLSAAAGISTFDGVWDQSLRLTYLDTDHTQKSAGVENAKTSAEKVGIYYQSTFHLPDWKSFASQHLIVALDYEDEDFSQRGTALDAFDPNQDQNMDNIGYVAEFMTRPVPQLDLSASVRYDENSDFADVTTYRFTSSYLISASSTRLHASYGEGQKSPTFIERFGFFPDQFFGNEDLQPEKNKGFDIGVQQRLFSDRASVSVTYFSERLEDEINGFAFDVNSGLFTAENLNGRSKRDGIEVELNSQLNTAVTLTGSYTYTDSREPDASGGRSRELRRPKHMAAMNLNAGLLAGRANLNINVSYTDDQSDRFFPPFPEAAQLVSLDSYVIVDIAGSYRFNDNVELYARANNSFDDSYQNVFGYRSPERAFYGGVRVNL